MVHLIDKDALIAKILRLKGLLLKGACASQISMQANCKEEAYNETLSILDTLEVKEVDFDAEWEKYFEHRGEITTINVKHLAKHFFELGLKARIDEALVEEVYSHIDSIKDTADRMTSGNFMHHRAAINVSANTIAEVLKLMGLKAQKGE